MQELPDAHLWVIDGIADLIQDPNNIEQSFGLIESIMVQSDRMNSAVIGILHENPGTNKARGNLGSEAERKCGGAITIKKLKEQGVHSIVPRLIRGSADFDTI